MAKEKEEQMELVSGVVEDSAIIDDLGEVQGVVEEGREVVAQMDSAVTAPAVMTEGGMLLQSAISQGANIETLERLIALKNREEDRAAKKEFDFHFAEMQKELVPVKKTKDGSKTNAGNVVFKYAPIEELKRPNDPIIHRHGFSYRWTKKELENGNLRVIIHISGWGHTDSQTYHDVPPNPKNSLQSQIQAEAVRTGYGKRYTFADGFGITVEDEDIHDSVATFENAQAHPELMIEVNNCQSLDELENTCSVLKGQLQGNNDEEGIRFLRTLYSRRKKAIKGGN